MIDAASAAASAAAAMSPTRAKRSDVDIFGGREIEGHERKTMLRRTAWRASLELLFLFPFPGHAES